MWSRFSRSWTRRRRCGSPTRAVSARSAASVIRRTSSCASRRSPFLPALRNANDVHESRLARSAARFPRALAFCQRIADLQRGELGRATLVALQPRGWVRPHVDAGAYYRVRDRFHLVLKSPGGSPLTAGGETVVMHEGELWAFDNKAEHDARNPSDEPRLHLIFDVLPPPGRGYYVLPPLD